MSQRAAGADLRRRRYDALSLQCLHPPRCDRRGRRRTCAQSSLQVSRPAIRARRKVRLDAGVRYYRWISVGEGQSPNLPLQKLGPLLFTGLAPEMSFDEWIAPVRERVSFMPLDAFMRDA